MHGHRRNIQGMTLMEILVVVTLLSGVTLLVYKAFTNGLQVWQKSRELVIEEDIAVFFEQFSRDIYNTVSISTMAFEGESERCSFPIVIPLTALSHHGLPENENVDQIGKIEYYVDHIQHTLNRRTADYGQALQKEFNRPRVLVTSIEGIRFSYYYFTDDGEVLSEKVLDVPPSGVEVKIDFYDRKGRRSMERYFDILIGIL